MTEPRSVLGLGRKPGTCGPWKLNTEGGEPEYILRQMLLSGQRTQRAPPDIGPSHPVKTPGEQRRVRRNWA